jgi:hypothetical protein
MAGPISGQGTWETTLLGRDINGNAVAQNDASAVFFYDTDLDITWLRDMNAGAGSIYDNGFSTTDGRMTWDNAVAWAGNLTVGSFGGWRLPTITDIGNDGCNFAYSGTDCGYNVDTGDSELAHLFYETLGNLAYCTTDGSCNQPGYGLTNTAEFLNMQSYVYWSGTEYAPSPSGAWIFDTDSGFQRFAVKVFDLYAVAVRPGDVVADVPEPGSLAILLTGLAALSVRRRRPH